MGDIHHIFPKVYLQKNKITDRSKYNQIANYIYLDTQTNISIGEKSPNEYFKTVFDQCISREMKFGNISNTALLKDNLSTNCIPENVVSMDATHYEDFLLERRKLMAKKIKDFYYSL